MVYCGKLSKACEQCRNRKLRCDLRRTACGQCVRAQLSCSGYRDTEQLRFRDERQAILKRNLKRDRPKSGNPSVPLAVSLSLKDRAKDAFFSQYVFGTLKTYDFLPSICSSESSVDAHLSRSIDAVSLAYFSHEEHSLEASRQARNEYIRALSLINSALQCPTLAKKDATLLSALLLDLFEKITNHEPRTTASWTSHVNGALALAELRGPTQFYNRTSLRMLLRLNTNLLISCVASDAPVPPGLVALRTYTSKFINDKDPKWRLMGLMIKYVNLQQSLKKGQHCVGDMIALLIDLDVEFLGLSASMPPHWYYDTIALKTRCGGVLEDHFHIYSDQHQTQTWNVLRLIRIMLNDTVLRLFNQHCRASFADGHPVPLPTLATDNIKMLVSEICASAPQYVGYETASSGGPDESVDTAETGHIPSTVPLRSKQYSAVQRLRCYTLIFPLYVAAQSAGSTVAQRHWINETLHFMSNGIGIKNARMVAKILEQGDKVNPWKVYALLGSYAFVA